MTASGPEAPDAETTGAGASGAGVDRAEFRADGAGAGLSTDEHEAMCRPVDGTTHGLVFVDSPVPVDPPPPQDPPPRDPLRVLLRRYRLAIVAVAAVLAGVGLVIGTTPWMRVALTLVALPVAACAVIDARVHRIPTPLVRAIAVSTVLVLGACTATTGAWADLGRAVGAGLATSGVFFALWWFTRGTGTGLGDVRLAGALALLTGWFGWAPTLWYVVAAYLVAFPLAVYRLVRGRRDSIPFGPALVIGWYLALAWVGWG